MDRFNWLQQPFDGVGMDVLGPDVDALGMRDRVMPVAHTVQPVVDGCIIGVDEGPKPSTVLRISGRSVLASV